MTTEQLVEANHLFVEFLGWDSGYVERKVKKPNAQPNSVAEWQVWLEEDHPLVEAIYTDRPGFEWNFALEGEYDCAIPRLVFTHDELRFHKDWNWLMPVVGKLLCRARLIEYDGWGTPEEVKDLRKALVGPVDIHGTFMCAVALLKLYIICDKR